MIIQDIKEAAERERFLESCGDLCWRPAAAERKHTLNCRATAARSLAFHTQEFPRLKRFFHPISSSIFLRPSVKWSRLKTSIPNIPQYTHTKPGCVHSPNTRVVSNLPLPPFNAHKQGLHPLPLTIWASHHPAYPAGFATPSTLTKHTRKRGFRV